MISPNYKKEAVQIYIRWSLCLVLITCIWLGHMWALKVTLTLMFIAGELPAIIYIKNKKKLKSVFKQSKEKK